jgi:hypothetical protein
MNAIRFAVALAVISGLAAACGADPDSTPAGVGPFDAPPAVWSDAGTMVAPMGSVPVPAPPALTLSSAPEPTPWYAVRPADTADAGSEAAAVPMIALGTTPEPTPAYAVRPVERVESDAGTSDAGDVIVTK